jgi:hypothetical protein
MINDYFPHIWKDPEKFRSMFGEGSTSQLRLAAL